MKAQGTHGWLGTVHILATDSEGRIVRDDRLHNLITDDGRDLIAQGLRVGGDCEIRYMAVGTGVGSAAVTDSALEAEVFRKQVTSQAAGSVIGESLTTVYLAPQDANYPIEELGWFGGTAAGTAPDSGVLLARVLYSHNKQASESLVITRSDKFTAT